jgi:phosphatidylserine/phosphatidylglycerophosphate/cardiolipin synthase-like enzyme
VVITGSFNWTRAGVLDNHDNVLIARNQPDVAAPYIKHMEALWKEYAAFQIHGAEG